MIGRRLHCRLFEQGAEGGGVVARQTGLLLYAMRDTRAAAAEARASRLVFFAAPCCWIRGIRVPLPTI